MNSTNLLSIYTDVCRCASEKCASAGEVVNSPVAGSPPRGFYTKSDGPVEILVVGKNPGHVLPSEAKLYKNLSEIEIVRAHWKFSNDTFFNLHHFKNGERSSTIFHKNLIKYLKEILRVDADEVFYRVAYTNLVKCSTAGNEQAKLSRGTMIECFEKHLSREIRFFEPKLILALGREVEIFLKGSVDVGCPVVYVKHPSYNYKKDELPSKLADLRLEYLRSQVGVKQVVGS